MTIYCITNINNGRKYIGKTTQRNPIRRWQSHLCSARKGKVGSRILNSAIRKHGEEAFTFDEILTADSEEDLAKLERLAIIHFNSLAPNGYNLSPDGNVAGEEGRKLLSESLKGNKNAAGKRSPEFSQTMSDALRKCKGYMFTSPENQTYFTTNLSAFCREQGLHISNASRVAAGQRKSVKGWKVEKVV